MYVTVPTALCLLPTYEPVLAPSRVHPVIHMSVCIDPHSKHAETKPLAHTKAQTDEQEVYLYKITPFCTASDWLHSCLSKSWYDLLFGGWFDPQCHHEHATLLAACSAHVRSSYCPTTAGCTNAVASSTGTLLRYLQSPAKCMCCHECTAGGPDEPFVHW